MRWGELTLILSLPAWPARGQPVRTQATSATAACSTLILGKYRRAQVFHSARCDGVHRDTVRLLASMQILCADTIDMQTQFLHVQTLETHAYTWRDSVAACIHYVHICRHYIHFICADIVCVHDDTVCPCSDTICKHWTCMCSYICECRHFVHTFRHGVWCSCRYMYIHWNTYIRKKVENQKFSFLRRS